MLRHRKTRRNTPPAAQHNQRLLRFETCEKRLALDGAAAESISLFELLEQADQVTEWHTYSLSRTVTPSSEVHLYSYKKHFAPDDAAYESINLFDQLELTDSTSGGQTYAFFGTPALAYGLNESLDFVDNRLAEDGGSLQYLTVTDTAGNAISLTYSGATSFSGGLLNHRPSYDADSSQSVLMLKEIFPPEPIPSLPLGPQMTTTLSDTADDTGEFIAIASLFSEISDGDTSVVGRPSTGVVAIAPSTTHPLVAELGSSASLAATSPLEQVGASPSRLTRAWAFEVASLESSLEDGNPLSDEINEATPHRPLPSRPAFTPTSYTPPSTGRSVDFLPVSNRGADAATLGAQIDDRASPPLDATSLAHDEAIASLADLDDSEDPYRLRIDHRYSLTALMLALLVADRVCRSSTPSDTKGDSAQEAPTKKPTV